MPRKPLTESPDGTYRIMTHNKLRIFALLVSANLLILSGNLLAQTTNQVSPPPKPSRAERDPLQMMEQSLNLSDEQAKQLEPVLKEQQAKITALRTNTALSRQERATRLREIQQTSDANLQRHLTPEQVEQWKTHCCPN